MCKLDRGSSEDPIENPKDNASFSCLPYSWVLGNFI